MSKRILTFVVFVAVAVGVSACAQTGSSTSGTPTGSGLPPAASQPSVASPEASLVAAANPVAGKHTSATTSSTSNPPLGQNPLVQRALKLFFAPEIRFQNALLVAEQSIDAQSTTPAAIASCQALAAAADADLAAATTPSAALNKLLGYGMADLQQAGDACASGDFATADTSLSQGITARAAAQNLIDEILDGGA